VWKFITDMQMDLVSKLMLPNKLFFHKNDSFRAGRVGYTWPSVNLSVQ